MKTLLEEVHAIGIGWMGKIWELQIRTDGENVRVCRRTKYFSSYPSTIPTSLRRWKPDPPPNFSLSLFLQGKKQWQHQKHRAKQCSESAVNALEFGALEEGHTWRRGQNKWPGGGRWVDLLFVALWFFFLLDRCKELCSGHVNFIDKFVLYQIKTMPVLFSKLHHLFFIRCYWFCSWQNKTDFNNSLTQFRIYLKKSDNS